MIMAEMNSRKFRYSIEKSFVKIRKFEITLSVEYFHLSSLPEPLILKPLLSPFLFLGPRTAPN